MDGFWGGGIDGNLSDSAIFYIDKRGTEYTGCAAFFSLDYSRYSTFLLGFPEVKDDGTSVGAARHLRTFREFFFKPEIWKLTAGHIASSINPELGPVYSWPPFELSLKLKLLAPERLHLEVLLDNVVQATASLARDSHNRKVTALTLEPLSWDEYKSHYLRWKADGTIFRGQREPWPIRTTLHRARRFDINRHATEEIIPHAKAFAGQLGRSLNLQDASDLQITLGFAQHYGHPTTVLDWSKSPYVAAYFACRGICDDPSRSISPTIFAFDQESWKKTAPQLRYMVDFRCGIAVMEPRHEGNDRLRAQEGVLTQCNVDPFEMWVDSQGILRKSPYVRAYRLNGNPLDIMRELRAMGICAATMFPDDEGRKRDVGEAGAVR